MIVCESMLSYTAMIAPFLNFEISPLISFQKLILTCLKLCRMIKKGFFFPSAKGVSILDDKKKCVFIRKIPNNVSMKTLHMKKESRGINFHILGIGSSLITINNV